MPECVSRLFFWDYGLTTDAGASGRPACSRCAAERLQASERTIELPG